MTDLQFVSDDGMRFQIVSAATEKDRSSVAVRVLGSASWLA